MRDATEEQYALEMARSALSRPGCPFESLPTRVVVVDAGRQRLTLIDDARWAADYPVSTALAGIGGEEGSHRTPPGWHRIHRRIGDGAPLGMVFESREPTGDIWGGEPDAKDLILTRVLTLEGLEEGINRGPGHDSLSRYIYIHGTNHPEAIGTPASHGCVRMRNEDVVELFDRVCEGDAVVIVESPVA